MNPTAKSRDGEGTAARPHVVSTLRDRAALSAALAAHVAALSRAAIAAQGRFRIALCGGSAVALLGPALAQEPLRSHIEWSAWHLFWVDERCVPFDHPDSNYRLAREAFLDAVPVPAAQVHPCNTGLAGEAAAADYESRLRSVCGGRRDAWPRLDLVLLGVGEDGHIASLFPGHPLLQERRKAVAWLHDAPKPPPERITLTLPVLNHAHNVAIVASGCEKAGLVLRALRGGPEADDLPVRRVHPKRGVVRWLLDREAGGRLLPGGEAENS